jgi:hypothetical protein
MVTGSGGASSRVRLPATALLVVGLLDVVMAVVIVVSGFFTGSFNLGTAEGVIGLFVLAAAVVIVLGAFRMGRLRGLGLARAACVLAMIPCVSTCFVVGVPAGVWGLVVLAAPEVKAAFR